MHAGIGTADECRASPMPFFQYAACLFAFWCGRLQSCPDIAGLVALLSAGFTGAAACTPDEGVRYTRRITQIWCGFFIANGSIIAALALLHADRAWTWYTGFISYLLMGALFAGEWIYRRIYLPT